MSTALQCGPRAHRLIVLVLLALTMSACSGGNDSSETSFGGDILDAATGSLEDLNIKRKEIPPLLVQVAANPYKPPAQLTCKCIKDELAQLDPLIGPDMQPKETVLAANDGFMSDVQNMELPTQAQAENTAHDAIMGLIRSETSFLPFRSIIRRITGADRHQHNIEEAYEAGKLRRAYLKGLAESKFGDKCLRPKLTIVPDLSAVPKAATVAE